MEILLTMLQTALGGALLANLEFDWRDASALFVLWLAQFLVPHLREEVAVAYGVWIAVLLIGFMIRGDRLLAPRYFLQAIRRTGQFGKP
jgi:hypothetical protein